MFEPSIEPNLITTPLDMTQRNILADELFMVQHRRVPRQLKEVQYPAHLLFWMQHKLLVVNLDQVLDLDLKFIREKCQP